MEIPGCEQFSPVLQSTGHSQRSFEWEPQSEFSTPSLASWQQSNTTDVEDPTGCPNSPFDVE
eukprot:scaffold2816_cov121-Cylindrotheca_fusiformis.AAC.22